MADGDTAFVCAKCGAPMVLRTTKRGKNTGKQFWGCSTFPKCRSIVPIADCSECGAPMVLRTTKRGKNTGKQFWGCSTFPKCRSIVPIADPGAGDDPADSDPVDAVGGADVCPFSSPPPGPPRGLLRKALAAGGAVWRRSLERDEPDANDRWDSGHRLKVVNYLDVRDGGRCGLCGGQMKLKGAHVEHVAPKRYAVFELSAQGTARQGTYYRSVLHGMDNLQLAHPRCNRHKGNAADIRRWRHPSMPPLVVAQAVDGRVLMLPPSGKRAS